MKLKNHKQKEIQTVAFIGQQVQKKNKKKSNSKKAANDKNKINFKKFQDEITMGVLTFKSGVTQKQINKILKNNNELRAKIDNPLDNPKVNTLSWLMGRGKYNVLDVPSLFQITSVCKIEILKLYGNNQPRVLLQISQVKFPALKLLNLYGNNILSIQCIQNMEFPFLEQLFLGGNKITQISSIKKCYFPSLKILGYQNNRLKDNCSYLSEMHAPILTNLQSEMVDLRDSIQGQNDFQWVIKMQSNIITTLLFESSERVKNYERYFRVQKRFNFISWD